MILCAWNFYHYRVCDFAYMWFQRFLGLGDVYQIGRWCLQWNIVMDDDIGGVGLGVCPKREWKDDGEWFADPEHHWQTSNLVKCVVSTAAP